MPATKINQLNKPTMTRIGNEVEAAVREVLSKYGIRTQYQGSRFDELEATLKLKISVSTSTGETQAARDFRTNASRFGLKQGDLGRIFNLKGVSYRITGAMPRRWKRPIVGKRVSTGKSYIFTADFVREQLLRAYDTKV